ncbi:MAG: CPBP family intramembrane metalloprotease [Candidatus Doudnabacteria bacterium]|nr:CPBP family intramembrane metalloprotease [Candidatus Doudnabacteria bacterium]
MLSTVLLNGRRLQTSIPLPSGNPPGWWTALELLVVGILVQIGLWTKGSTRGRIIVLGAAWLALTTLWDKTCRKEMGLSLKNFKASLWLIEPVVVLVIIIWLSGVLAGTAPDTYYPRTLLERKLGYFLSAFCQQFLMQSYVFTRLQKIAGKKALGITAVCFSLAHVPNPALMLIALGGGWVSGSIFRKQRNLCALALAHGIVGAAMSEFWPSWIMRAGVGAFLKWNGS